MIHCHFGSCRDADTVMEAVEFVLQNFTEMNKLWVRIQLQVCGTFELLFTLFVFVSLYVHDTKVLACHGGKMNHEGMIFGHAGVMVCANHSYTLAILS